METPLKSHYPRPQPPPYNCKSPPPPSPNHRHRQNLQQQRQQHGGSRLAMRHLTFQRISANRTIVPLNRSRLPQFFFSLHNTTMSDLIKEKSQLVDASKSALNIVDGKQEPVKSEPIPPPPEKPLPGDCCGSGCVRCVWDVYYEELEEYNNLYKSKSEAIVDPKPS